MIELQVNGKKQRVDASGDTPLLWVLRDYVGLTGTKFGCGVGLCGACTVHLNGEAVRSCVTPVAEAAKARITTIEGLSKDRSHPVQQAWIAEQVPQCGYCQSGMLMAAVALLKKNPKPSKQQIAEGMSNICRCGTYAWVEQAIEQASRQLART